MIAAGQTEDEDDGQGFALFTWDGVGAPREIQAFRSILDAHPHFHPEGVVPLLERSGDQLVPSKRALVLSDDGTKPLPSGISCKEQASSTSHPGGDRDGRVIRQTRSRRSRWA